jgi:flagellar hook-associated protein 3 FlgL
MNVPGIDAFNTKPKDSSDARRMNSGEGYGATTSGRGPASVEGGGDLPGENVNVFDELQNLRISLLTGDLDGIRNTIERLDDIHGKLVATRAKVGSRIQGLQSTAQATDRHNLTNAQLTSQLEDADMAQVVSDLAKDEAVFRSALGSSQKLIQPTLLDFLK